MQYACQHPAIPRTRISAPDAPVPFSNLCLSVPNLKRVRHVDTDSGVANPVSRMTPTVNVRGSDRSPRDPPHPPHGMGPRSVQPADAEVGVRTNEAAIGVAGVGERTVLVAAEEDPVLERAPQGDGA